MVGDGRDALRKRFIYPLRGRVKNINQTWQRYFGTGIYSKKAMERAAYILELIDQKWPASTPMIENLSGNGVDNWFGRAK
jgi:hypothetical protein